MQNTAEEVETSSLGMYSCGPLHMYVQRQDDQLEPTYSSSVPIWDVALRSCRKQWTIGMSGERSSGISVLIARQICVCVCVRVCVCVCVCVLHCNVIHIYILFLNRRIIYQKLNYQDQKIRQPLKLIRSPPGSRLPKLEIRIHVIIN